eukprot:TRINITY_DN7998_c0_g1_i1.p1 TRINITY_DN7998_c0_g1~~TRINITY_DN7998_c0_g1_i1.p1  ORF type:complete len:166 (+),score=21.41 TRINITY_DN7998_c0_g1_i1:689-1186(+)
MPLMQWHCGPILHLGRRGMVPNLLGQDLLRWIPCQVTHGSWKYSIDFKNFENLLTTLRSKRLSSISKNELVCRYGVLKDTLELLACDCSGTGSNCSSKLASTLSSNNHVLSVCTGIPYVSFFIFDFIGIYMENTNNFNLILFRQLQRSLDHPQHLPSQLPAHRPF